MKKITLGFSILVASALFLPGCKKDKNVEPAPDKEFQSSVDVSYAAMVISDIEMICAYVGDNDLRPKFYMPAANSTGTTVPNRDTSAKQIFVSFNNTQCLDGHLRDGTIKMNYFFQNPNSKYYHDYQFVGNVELFNYKVDGWSVTLRNSFIIKNLLPAYTWSPSTTNLSWSMNGDFDIKHPTDSTKNIHCNVDLVKTLANTSTPTVFPVSKQAAINWSLAVVEYKGKMFGETSRTVPFVFNVTDKPMVRDFTCSPDKVNGVTVTGNTVTPRYEEFHPFTNGVASFTTSTLYPRYIYYGAQDGSSPAPCDNSGAVTIKGISYPIDFKKEYK